MAKKLNFILNIDDDEATNFFNEIILKDRGVAEEIKSMLSAEDALKTLKDLSNNGQMPDLIFLDINMPPMNGWEFLDAYREELPESQPVIIVMLSTSLNPDDRERAESNSLISDFISKPLDHEKIQMVLDKHFA